MLLIVHPDDSVVHSSGIGQLQANPPVAGSRRSPGKPIQQAATMMGNVCMMGCGVWYVKIGHRGRPLVGTRMRAA